jgi:very-short-patch-repair endonuclease
VTLIATDIERIVMSYLDKRGIRYEFQTSLAGGHYELGGAVVDFIINGVLAWRVMGEYWHEGVEQRGKDMVQREILTSMGFIVVDLWGEDIKQNTDSTLTKALAGEDVMHA